MTPEQWERAKHFDPSEKWGDPAKMDVALVFALDDFREHIGRPIVIHCGYEQRDRGYHPCGMAVDVHVPGLSAFQQFILAQGFPTFRGIGLYPNWNNPGLHLDTRHKNRNEPRTVWGATAPGMYTNITKDFMQMCY